MVSLGINLQRTSEGLQDWVAGLQHLEYLL